MIEIELVEFFEGSMVGENLIKIVVKQNSLGYFCVSFILYLLFIGIPEKMIRKSIVALQ